MEPLPNHPVKAKERTHGETRQAKGGTGEPSRPLARGQIDGHSPAPSQRQQEQSWPHAPARQHDGQVGKQKRRSKTMKGAAKGPAPPREVTAASVAPMAADVKKDATNKSAKARRTRRTRRTKQCRRRRVATKNRGPTGAEAIKKGRAAARPRSRTSQAKASFKKYEKIRKGRRRRARRARAMSPAAARGGRLHEWAKLKGTTSPRPGTGPAMCTGCKCKGITHPQARIVVIQCTLGSHACTSRLATVVSNHYSLGDWAIATGLLWHVLTMFTSTIFGLGRGCDLGRLGSGNLAPGSDADTPCCERGQLCSTWHEFVFCSYRARRAKHPQWMRRRSMQQDASHRPC